MDRGAAASKAVHELSLGSPRKSERDDTHSSLQLLANVFRDNNVGAYACRRFYGSCALSTSFVIGVLLGTRDCQGSMELTIALIEGVSCDLAARVNVVAKHQVQ